LDRQIDPAAAGKRLSNNFDGLRLLLAFVVILGHQDHRRQWAADAAVLAFFVLSGLLISRSWFADPNVWRFVQRRFLRIWPALALVVLVCSAAIYVFASGPWAQMEQLASVFYLRNLWLNIFDWSFFPWRPPGMNGSVWTLPFEVDLYAALALIGLMGRRAFFVVALLVWVAAFFSVATVGSPTSVGSAWSLYFAGFFFGGALLGRWSKWLRPSVVLLAVGVGAALLACGWGVAGRLILIPAATVGIGMRSWPVLQSLSKFGDLSYGTYLWGWPVQQVTRLWLPADTGVWLQLLVVVPQVLILALISWHVVEKTALRRKPHTAVQSGGARSGWRLRVGSLRETREKWKSLLGKLARSKGVAASGDGADVSECVTTQDRN
jgi:peptidoglycan/LPS O-acetylase OafA/YrhL